MLKQQLWKRSRSSLMLKLCTICPRQNSNAQMCFSAAPPDLETTQLYNHLSAASSKMPGCWKFRYKTRINFKKKSGHHVWKILARKITSFLTNYVKEKLSSWEILQRGDFFYAQPILIKNSIQKCCFRKFNARFSGESIQLQRITSLV